MQVEVEFFHSNKVILSLLSARFKVSVKLFLGDFCWGWQGIVTLGGCCFGYWCIVARMGLRLCGDGFAAFFDVGGAAMMWRVCGDVCGMVAVGAVDVG